MKKYEFNIDFTQNSLNKNNFYNIYFEDRLFVENIQFPYIIKFDVWKNEYNILVENISYCGSKKQYTIQGIPTTTYTTQIKPLTTKLYIAPTTVALTSTTLNTTSTTTIRPKRLIIQSASVIDCIQNDGTTNIKTLITFGGNYSGKLRLQITNVTVFGSNTNSIVVRNFYSPIITTGTYEYILKKGTYNFEAFDVENDEISDFLLNVDIQCPEPSFELEYIPNTCGLFNAKVRIFNIKNANIFRYCFATTFICDNRFDTPDGIIIRGQSELIIENIGGVLSGYVNNTDKLIVRGFNGSVDKYKDVMTSVKSCIIVPVVNKLTFFVDYTFKTTSNSGQLVLYAIKDGKKFTTPKDISISGFYVFLTNQGTFVTKDYFTIIKSNTNKSVISIVWDVEQEITDACISTIETTLSNDYQIINGSLC